VATKHRRTKDRTHNERSKTVSNYPEPGDTFVYDGQMLVVESITDRGDVVATGGNYSALVLPVEVVNAIGTHRAVER
jgi:hypothetical protein